MAKGDTVLPDDRSNSEMMTILGIFADVIKYKEKYAGQYIVVKVGGALLEDPQTITNLARQCAFLRHNFDANVVLVHGGGPQIDKQLKRKRIPVLKDDKTGLRITDEKTLNVTDNILRSVNGAVVSAFNRVAPNVKAIGMAGYEGRTIGAESSTGEPGNYTGHIRSVDKEYLKYLMDYKQEDVVPVIYPICHDLEGKTSERRLNVNADEVANKIASELDAIRLVLASNVQGVLDQKGALIAEVSVEEVDGLVSSGVVSGGMIQKLRNAAHAADMLSRGSVVLLDGRTSSSIVAEFLYDKGSGTLIAPKDTLQKEKLANTGPSLL